MDATQQIYDMILNLMVRQFQYSSTQKVCKGCRQNQKLNVLEGVTQEVLQKISGNTFTCIIIHSGFSSLLHKDAVMVHLCPVSSSNITNMLLSVLFRKWQQIGM